MPNYIKNILTLEGSLSESDRLLSAIRGGKRSHGLSKNHPHAI